MNDTNERIPSKRLQGITKGLGRLPGPRSFLKLLFSPPILVCLLTLAPFFVPLLDFLNDQTRGFSREVGIDFGLCGYALVCVLAFWFGYKLFLTGGSPPSKKIQQASYVKKATKKCRRSTIMAVFVLVAITLAIVLYTVSGTYLEGLIQSALIKEANPTLRESSEGFIASESVPGILRMFAHSAIGALILMYAVSLVAPSWSKGWRRGYWFLLLVSGLAVLARSFMVLDRSSLVIALTLAVFVLTYRMRFTKTQFIVSALGISLVLLITILFINFVYSVRMDEEKHYNQILEYADLGIANASLAYRTTSHFGWGTETLMGPVRMVPRGLGINFDFPLSDSEWIWNEASNLLCVSIREFWMFGFIIYLVYGAVMGRVMRGRRNYPRSMFWGVAHLWGLYILLTFWTQPQVASPDLWIAIIMTLVIARYLDGRTTGLEKRFRKVDSDVGGAVLCQPE